MALKDFLFADDIFISYTRKDAATYAASLAARLTSEGYSCYLDLATTPGTDLFSSQSRAIRRCRAMVVIVSPMASSSALVEAQVRGFLRSHGKFQLVIPISFGDVSLGESPLLQLFVGRPIHNEHLDALESGAVSETVIDPIIKSFQFASQSRRLTQAIWSVATVFVLIIVIMLFLVLPMRTTDSKWVASFFTGVICLFLGIPVGFIWRGFTALNRKSAEVSRVASETTHTGGAALSKSFISYSHADKPFARLLEVALAQRGVHCWMDEKKLQPGDDIYDEISKAIEDFDKFLLCCSKHSLKSWWVDNELGTAFQKEEAESKKQGRLVRIVIPLNLDNMLFNDALKSSFKSQLRRRVAVDFTDWRDGPKFEKKVDSILSALRNGPS
jgi:hypothetical protein